MDTNKLIPLLSEMAIFVNVVESGSFSKAAHKLGIAPSSVSRSVSRLENALQEKLLERTTRQMRLSLTGQEVFSFCREMLTSAQMAVHAAQADRDDVSGSLRIAAPKALAKTLLTPIVLDFIRDYPRVSLQLKVADHYIDPISDEVDVLIQITDSPVEGLVARTLGNCRLIVCASPDYLEKYGMPGHPEDLRDHSCLYLGENPRDRFWEFSRAQDKSVVSVSGPFAVNHSEIRREAVLQGLGISIFPEFMITPYLRSRQVVEVLPDWKIRGNYQGKIIAQYAQSRFIPNQIKVFVEYIRTRFISDSGVQTE
ncbi:LysR family transcriptional regulator [Vibrio mangrovi]|uniref:HTH-type transcriptional regulator DmlR n=1 Tax=Vibrio mangrovi TaxID=474394 RepID=A0A1Y6ITJ2_9VIBR|nr:LysR family transcriptional regulator [Vibrio mangrovi]MDW6001833.1 LysR family transcriptional regulator [Vibrio mangrovi]SMS00140.1 HTH-type transcriptional regulator DmlR [Vibrio mangrovi]